MYILHLALKKRFGDRLNDGIRCKIYTSASRRHKTHVVDVTEVDAFEHLPENTANSLLVEAGGGGALVEIVKHRVVDELEHQVEVLLATEHFDQIHEVFVPQLLQFTRTAHGLWFYTSSLRPHAGGARNIVMSQVGLFDCLSVRSRNSKTTRPIFLCVLPVCGHSSVLLWRRCHTLYVYFRFCGFRCVFIAWGQWTLYFNKVRHVAALVRRQTVNCLTSNWPSSSKRGTREKSAIYNYLVN